MGPANMVLRSKRACRHSVDPTLSSETSINFNELVDWERRCPAGKCPRRIYFWNPKQDPTENVELLKPGGTVIPQSVTGSLALVFGRMRESKRRAIDPSPLVESLTLDRNLEQDVQEFTSLLLVRLEYDLAHQSNPLIKTLCQDLFQGKTQHIIECLNCHGKFKGPVENFYTLILNPVVTGKVKGPKEPKSLMECIVEYLMEESLQGENQYYCSVCKSKQNATRKTNFIELPQYVCFQVIRFKYDGASGTNLKISDSIKFEANFDFGLFFNSPGEYQYHLFAGFSHLGASAESGHFVANILDTGGTSWIRCNDDSVSISEIPELNPDSLRDKPQRGRTRKPTYVSSTTYFIVYARNRANPESIDPEPSLPDWLTNLLQTDPEVRRVSSVTASSPEEELMNKQQLIAGMFDLAKPGSDVPVGLDDWYLIPSEYIKDWISGSMPTLWGKAEPVTFCKHNRVSPLSLRKYKCVPAEVFRYRDICRICVTRKAKLEVSTRELAEDIETFEEILKVGTPRSRGPYVWVGKESLMRWSKLANYVILNESNDRDAVVQRDEIEQVEHLASYAELGTNDKEIPAKKSKVILDPSAFFNEEILCPHGNLGDETSEWTLVPPDAWNILQKYFPNAPRFEKIDRRCVECEKEDLLLAEKAENLKSVVAELKALLPWVKSTKSRFQIMGDDNHVVFVPRDFVKQLEAFMKAPHLSDEPREMDCSEYICAHSLLNIDPRQRIMSMQNGFLPVTAESFEVVEERYQCLFILRGYLGDAKSKRTWSHVELDPDVCEMCYEKRLEQEKNQSLIYSTKPIFVQKVGIRKAILTAIDRVTDLTGIISREKLEVSENELKEIEKRIGLDAHFNEVRRITRPKNSAEESRFVVSSTDTLKSLKHLIAKRFTIPLSDQRLFFNSRVLLGDEKTLSEFEILPFCHLKVVLRVTYEELKSDGTVSYARVILLENFVLVSIAVCMLEVSENEIIYSFQHVSISKMLSDVSKLHLSANTGLLAQPDDPSSRSPRHGPNINGSLSIHGMHLAAVSGDKVKMMSYLAVGPQFLEIRDRLGRTPLMYAVFGDKEIAVEFLLKAGARIESHDMFGRTALHYIAHKDRIQSMKAIICKLGLSKALVDSLLWQDGEMCTPIHLATKHLDCKLLGIFLKKTLSEGVHIDVQDQAKRTPLHWACLHANAKAVGMLLANGANGGISDVEGRTPLHWAAEFNARGTFQFRGKDAGKCISLILEKSPTLINRQDFSGQTCLHVAAMNANPDIISSLLNKYKSSVANKRRAVLPAVNLTDHSHRTPLHWASALGHVFAVQLLLNHGADLCATDVGGACPSHYAALNGQLDVLKCLLCDPRVIESVDQDGNTAFHWATAAEHHGGSSQISAVLAFLIQVGSNIKAINKFGLTGIDINAKDNVGQTAAHLLALGGFCDPIAYLITRADFQMNIQDDFGLTPLHCAAGKGHVSAVELLANAGVNLDLLSWLPDRPTALDLSIWNDQPAVAEFLKAKNASSAAPILHAKAKTLQSWYRRSIRDRKIVPVKICNRKTSGPGDSGMTEVLTPENARKPKSDAASSMFLEGAENGLFSDLQCPERFDSMRFAPRASIGKSSEEILTFGSRSCPRKNLNRGPGAESGSGDDPVWNSSLRNTHLSWGMQTETDALEWNVPCISGCSSTQGAWHCISTLTLSCARATVFNLPCDQDEDDFYGMDNAVCQSDEETGESFEDASKSHDFPSCDVGKSEVTLRVDESHVVAPDDDNRPSVFTRDEDCRISYSFVAFVLRVGRNDCESLWWNDPLGHEAVIVNSAILPSNTSFSCDSFSCFDVNRCGRHPEDDDRLTVYVYPYRDYRMDDGSPVTEGLTAEFWEVLLAIKRSPYYVSDPEEACVFVPSIDAFNQLRIRPRETGQVLATLPFWNGGRNHLIFSMVLNAVPRYHDITSLPSGMAMLAAAGFPTRAYRNKFDVSLPSFWGQSSTLHLTNESWDEGAKHWLVMFPGNSVPERAQKILEKFSTANDDFLMLRTCENSEEYPQRRCHNGIAVLYPYVLKRTKVGPVIYANSPLKNDGFTAVILTYDRVESLFALIERVAEAPSVSLVLIVWNNENKPPPKASLWPSISKPLKVIQSRANKLSSRFFPYREISTEAVLALDDDILMLTIDELEFGYQHWNHVYTYDFPSDLREWVDLNFNCEDIAMNFIVANCTGKSPIKVAPRKKFKCPHCINAEISADARHMLERSDCVNRFAERFGYLPLRTVEFRADPVLYKDHFPDKLKLYKDIESL
ncbi:unnamed protein product [Notodromas monacha]|uniref:Ubiquitinyl hydrolase 1 n=1 Tax=Notodromas monacha TaxID=399045 RepID=A0A7R9BJ39_9CRUS|nr:unnamed protein product [Notodromas monacha]CAG0915051.1 unnamed protein product [Notodromas monacha]